MYFFKNWEIRNRGENLVEKAQVESSIGKFTRERGKSTEVILAEILWKVME